MVAAAAVPDERLLWKGLLGRIQAKQEGPHPTHSTASSAKRGEKDLFMINSSKAEGNQGQNIILFFIPTH